MKYAIIILALALSSCGYSSRENEMIGQVKKVSHETPILCDDRADADISLGILRNGVGSMSSQDVWVTVPNESDRKTLKDANESGALVKIKYDVKRVTWCWHDHIVTSVEVVK